MDDDKCFLLEIQHTKKYKFKKDIIIKNYPDNFLTNNVEKYYRRVAKYDYNRINYFDVNNFDYVRLSSEKIWMLFKSRKINFAEPIPFFMNTIFDIDYFKNIKNFVQVDLSYTAGQYEWVKNQIINFEKMFKRTFKTIFKRGDIKIKSIYHPYYDICDRNMKTAKLSKLLLNKILLKEKIDLIYMNCVLPNEIRTSISYYSEHIYSIISVLYIYYILLSQKNNGSFIIQYTSFDTKLSRDHLKIFRNYYEKIFISTCIMEGQNITYLIGKNFLGITSHDLNIFKSIYEDICTKKYHQNPAIYLNIFDTSIRTKNYVSKHLANFNTNDFLHKIVDFEENKKEELEFNLKLDEYNKKTYSYMLKESENIK